MLSFDCIQLFSRLYLLSLFCSQFTSITFNSSLLLNILLGFLSFYLLWKLFQACLIGRFDPWWCGFNSQLGSSAFPTSPSQVWQPNLSFILHIFVASPESLGLSWVCQALDNCLRWRRALDDSTPWRNFTSLRIVELQTFYFLDGKACFQHTSWETPYIAKFSVLNDLPIHPHWREHWRNTEIEAIPVFLKEDAFVCSPSCLFWLCASVWIPAPLISVSPLTLQCQLFII